VKAFPPEREGFVVSSRKKGGLFVRQITAAIYISFGILFYLLEGFEGFIGPDFMGRLTPLFILVGVIYLSMDFRDFVKKKLQ